MHPESLRAPLTRREESSHSSVELNELGPRAKGMGMDMGVDVEGKRVAGGEEKGEGKPVEVVNVGSSKGSVRTDGPGDVKKGDGGQDTKKSGDKTVNSSDNITPVIATDNTAKPVADDVKPTTLATTTKSNFPEVPSAVVNAALKSGTPIATMGKKDNAEKGKVNPTINEEKAEQALDGKRTKPKEPVVTDEGDVATPKRVTKELPPSPAKSKEKPVPTLGLTVPTESPKNGSAPTSIATVTGSTLSPLQKALADAEDETLMERMARLKIEGSGFQPQKEVVPPAHTDLDSEFECETAPSGPSTPRSKAGASFNLLLRSDVPLSDDDDFFLDCDSNASVSNFDGL